MSGWIKIHRKIENWEWYKNPNTFRLFFYLLIKAAYEETEYRGIKLLPGQLVGGREWLASKTGLTDNQIRTAIITLKSTNEITTSISGKHTVITIVNWFDYQEDHQNNNQKKPQKVTRIITTDIREKKIRNKEYTGDGSTKFEFPKSYPAWLPKEAWAGYVEMRKTSKKMKFTDRAEELAIKSLEEFQKRGANVAAIINQSVEKGWASFYELKGGRGSPDLPGGIKKPYNTFKN